ncbi:MAG TPA: hypothetical protein VG842_06360 [Sediminibacterium sp.]|nr:hypothetical protein [Sediminibacterium sp.]
MMHIKYTRILLAAACTSLLYLLGCHPGDKKITAAAHAQLVDSCNRLIDRLIDSSDNQISDETLKDSSLAIFAAAQDVAGEAEVTGIFADGARRNGNYAKAMQYYFDMLQKSRDAKDTILQMQALLGLSDIYRTLQDTAECLQQAYRILPYLSKKGDRPWEDCNLFINLAYLYDQAGRYDSAGLFIGQTRQHIRGLPLIDSLYYSGGLEIVQGNIALHKFRTGMQKADADKTLLDSLKDEADQHYSAAITRYYLNDADTAGILYSERQDVFAEAYFGQGILSQLYGMHSFTAYDYRMALEMVQYKNPELKLKILDSLISFYAANPGKRDSAFVFLKQEQALKDTLNSTHARMIISNQRNYEEKFFAREEAETKRRLNQLTYMLVPPFIVAFVYVILLLGRMKIHERVIESLGLLATIMVFEFIALILHGYFDRLTHENPLLLLLALVLVGLALEPLHNYFQDWLKKKLAHNREPGEMM